MKLSESFFYTLRENLKDEDSISGNFLVRSGMIKKSSAGVYMFLPLGLKVLNKVENIIREEMNQIGALELLMPALISKEVYDATGRTESFGDSLFTLKDRYNRDYVLGPTHEELFAIASFSKIKSYKDMPYLLYQFQTKFRDEARPRFGLIRVREFVMKDAYSFDRDLEELNISYTKMFEAYKKAFDRMSLKYKIVKADTGVMGGLLSEEFQAVTDIGEDTLVLCENCEYASNLEITPYVCEEKENSDVKREIQKVYTPNCKTIEDVYNFLEGDAQSFVKALMFQADGKLVICFVPGSREVNIAKLGKLIGANEIEMAEEEFITSNSNAVPGFTGPYGLESKDVTVVFDVNVLNIKNAVVGANEIDYHYKNVDMTEFRDGLKGDICTVIEGDICPNCGKKKLYFKKGIEIGNTFKLGTKYSESLGLNYLDQDNKLNPVVMGCYGIGPARCMAAIVEQNHDDKGIIWPMNIAPFKVCIVLISSKDEKQKKVAEEIYKDLNKIGIETILDDRDERPGVKFNDMDLIGIPIRVTIGKKVEQGQVELKLRNSEEVEVVDISNIEEKIQSIINE